MVNQKDINNRDIIYRLRQLDSTIPAIRLAQILNLSRSRVGQLLVALKQPTRVSNIKSIKTCLICGQQYKRVAKTCSPSCRLEYYYIVYKCPVCAKEKYIYRRRLLWIQKRGRNVFCSHACSTLWLWENRAVKKYPKEVVSGTDN